MIHQHLINSLNQLNLLRQLEVPEKNITLTPADHKNIFIAKFTHKTNYVSLVFFVGAFLAQMKMTKQISSLQGYFDQLNENFDEQKKLLPGIFESRRIDPTFKRSVQITVLLVGTSIANIVTSVMNQPTRVIPLSDVFMFCKHFVKLSSLSYCLEFCTLCSMLEYHFVYINSILCQMATVEKVWYKPWFGSSLEKVGIWHRTLCETLNEVNRMHQLQSLLSVVSWTIHLLPHLFLFGIRLIGSEDSKEYYSVIQFVLSIRYIVMIYLRCHFTSNVTYEANKTKMHLCNFLMKYKDEQLIAQIKTILQQMSCGNTEFRLCGLVIISTSFFLSTMLAVVGYFIIILQSYMSELDSEN
uniref:Gustatory receptor n=1 Tax=Cacopsylla melanoneura TaxID=428564 RepID=A0A8D8ZC31_9HEMI